MFPRLPTHNLWTSLKHIAGHAAITLLAVSIAFGLPDAARYILYEWWPKVQEDAHSLLYTEIAFAAVLVLLINLAKLSWQYRHKARMTEIASLVYARERGGWLSRLLRQDLIGEVPWKRDVTIMAVSGYGTFAAPDAELRNVLRDSYEVRVMLLNPYSDGAQSYANSHPDPAAALASFRRETAASIAYLRELQASGKQISLKLYESPPFWKLVFTGEHAWVRCCHTGQDAGTYPEYVFGMHREKPTRGFFPAFYTYFLNQWNDPRHPDFSLEGEELIYRNSDGLEVRRSPFPLPQPERTMPNFPLAPVLAMS